MPQTANKTLDDLIIELGLTYVATFQPGAPEKPPQLSWHITLENAKGYKMSANYYQGIGHILEPAHAINDRVSYQAAKRAKQETCKDGIIRNIYGHKTARKQPAPGLKDVLYCLVSDAISGRDTFDDFCANLGYDTDSGRALNLYLECQDQGHGLRRLIGSKALEDLWEAYQDY